MKRFLPMAIAGLAMCLITSFAEPAKAQSDASIIIQALCGLLPANEQVACLNEYSYYVGPNEAVMEKCNGFFMLSDKNACYQIARETKYISNAALTTCDGLFMPSDKLSCIWNIREMYYSSNALNVCNGLFMPSGKLKCLDIIANRHYTSSEINACSQFFMENDTLRCLRDFGRAINIPTGGVVGRTEPIARPLPPIVTIPVPVNEECLVTNSTGKELGTISPDRFYNYLATEAVQNHQCTVGWQKNTQYSRILFDSNGSVLGENLSESEVNKLKSRNGLSRCQVRICEIN